MKYLNNIMINHFNPDGLQKVITEIKTRHKKGYGAVIDSLVSQIKLFHRRNGSSKKFVILVSGGIDSSVVAFLAKKAVGVNKIIPIYLPARNNDEGLIFYNVLKKYLKTKNISQLYITKPVKELIDLVEKNIKKPLDLITKGNIASRLRINVAYAIAKETDGIVLGTSNRTEFLQGYATKYGTPISCDFGVLDDLYKTDILEIASLIGVPQKIINRKPTTGFYVGQSHETELGAKMLEQDAAAYLLFEKKYSISEIVKRYGASKKYLESFVKRYEANLHKRRLQAEHISLGYIK